MATLNQLKEALRGSAPFPPETALTDEEYSTGLDILIRGSETTYQDFIIPQLSDLLTSRSNIYMLEVGPGPKTVFQSSPDHERKKIKKYTAYEPNVLFASELEEAATAEGEKISIFSGLEERPNIHRKPFGLDGTVSLGRDISDEKFDVILFCHSMYGMNPKRAFIKRAFALLAEGGTVVVFHREGASRIEDLVCHRTASFPTAVVRVPNEDDALDSFAAFIVSLNVHSLEGATHREICRSLGRIENDHTDHLIFDSPEIMLVFTKHADKLPKLTTQVPLVRGIRPIKNPEARQMTPAAVVKPTDIQQVQHCVRWALKYGFSLTVLGGTHSGNCLQANVVAVDMSAFDQIHTLADVEGGPRGASSLIVAGTGSNAGDIIRKTMEKGLTVLMGARPSVGAGLWLQGGVGHISRLHSLTCDSIVGAVVVSLESGQVFHVGTVPSAHRPVGSVQPANAKDMLWALKGASTNFGILISVVFKTYPAQTHSIWNWVLPLQDEAEAPLRLQSIDSIASELPRNCSVDAICTATTTNCALA